MHGTLYIGAALLGAVAGGAALWAYWHGRLARVRQHAVGVLKTAAEQASQHYMRFVDERARHCRALQDRAHAEIDIEERELHGLEQEFEERCGALQRRERELEQAIQVLQRRQQAVNTLEQQQAGLAQQHAHLEQRLLDSLGRRAQCELAALQDQLTQELRERAKLQGKLVLHNNEQRQRSQEHGDSRRILTLTMGRYDGVGHLERVAHTISIDSPGLMDALADPEGTCQTMMSQEVGCEVVCDTEARTATIRGDDPLAREIGRRVLHHVARNDAVSADDLRRLTHEVRTTVEEEIAVAATEACKILEINEPHPDIMHLVGRLKYRLSYSQNQWKHAVEVARLADMMARELGLDPMLARRGGLLHDIGKAMTHDHEGAHAVLGARVARECGECEIVANAIGSHHNDEPPGHPIAHIVIAADAISGARPGARRDSATNYLQMVSSIQHIAHRSPCVQRVDIMQAGREVRVVVAGNHRGAEVGNAASLPPALLPHELHTLAQDIARSIEEEVTYAGQVRVTVIQEFKAISLAH